MSGVVRDDALKVIVTPFENAKIGFAAAVVASNLSSVSSKGRSGFQWSAVSICWISGLSHPGQCCSFLFQVFLNCLRRRGAAALGCASALLCSSVGLDVVKGSVSIVRGSLGLTIGLSIVVIGRSMMVIVVGGHMSALFVSSFTTDCCNLPVFCNTSGSQRVVIGPFPSFMLGASVEGLVFVFSLLDRRRLR